MVERRNRSDKYQYLILETSYSHDMLEAFSNSQSISHLLNPFHYNEDLLDFEDELKTELYRLIDKHLTDRQKEVIKLCIDGYTQMEIARKLGVNQSSITKSLHGNVDYKNNSTKSYGGSFRKIQKLIENDKKIKEILKKIRDAQEEKW